MTMANVVVNQDEFGLARIVSIDPPEGTEVVVSIDVLRGLLDRVNVATLLERGLREPMLALREEIAKEIEALPIDHRKNEQGEPTGRATFTRMEAYRRAASVARGDVDV